MFDWTGFLTVAEALGGESDEAFLRSAISRAYYAAYARHNHLLSMRRPKHLELWTVFIVDANPDRSAVGVRGQALMHDRHAADYVPQFPGQLPQRANNAITEARALLAAVAHLS